MSNIKVSAITTVFLLLGICAETCQAGPLLDWLRGYPSNPYRYNAYYQGPAAATPGYAQMPGSCTTTCPKTCYQTVNRVVANYVPYTAFRTEWYRVPVTYYRPVTSSNPQTGCVTTCMQPCTYYQMQARRVPYTTYQTVYRTVQQRIPYTVYETTYGSSCGTSGSCTSCGVNPAPMSAPTMSSPTMMPGTVSNYGLNPNGQYSVPANSVPQLSPGEIQPDTTLQRPVTDDAIFPESDPTVVPDNSVMPPETTINPSSHSPSSADQPRLNVPVNPPPLVESNGRTAARLRGEWSYTPVRQAGYRTTVRSEITGQPASNTTLRGSDQPFRPAFRESGWKSTGR